MKLVCKKTTTEQLFFNFKASWKTIHLCALKNVGETFIFHCNFDLKLLILEKVPLFYKEIFGFWQEFIQICN
jgi:hypothetical protein